MDSWGRSGAVAVVAEGSPGVAVVQPGAAGNSRSGGYAGGGVRRSA